MGRVVQRQNYSNDSAMKKYRALFYFLLLSCLSKASYAQVLATMTLAVQATVLAICKIQATQHIDFGMIDPAQVVNTQAQGLVRVACSRGLNFKITVNYGQAFDERRNLRQMRNISGETLPYSLTLDKPGEIGKGFHTPIDFSLSAQINGRDYVDLPSGIYSDVLRVAIEL